jgi:alkanesulfonate monooxygenase SsuD/methylene tetrahydromethanopterin reductase-like flavin-dependent oxidoreductase (luciferase family)
VRTAVSLPPFTDAATVVALAVEAERAGWDGVFLWDHLVFNRRVRLDVHDPWVLLGAVAQATERVRLGTLVTPLARRRPWIVAKHFSHLRRSTTKSMQWVSASMSSGSIAGNIAIRSWLRPNLR